MSYEGYTQYICGNGHYCHLFSPQACLLSSNACCPDCESEYVWENSVDLTNGSYDIDGNRMDGYIELEIVNQEKCEHCDSILSTVYKIPEDIK